MFEKKVKIWCGKAQYESFILKNKAFSLLFPTLIEVFCCEPLKKGKLSQFIEMKSIA